MFVRLQTEPFDPGAELNAFTNDGDQDGARDGAIVSFTGIVRSNPDAPITALTLEHYPALAQSQIEGFAQDALQRFDLGDIGVIHRHGTLKLGEVIVMVIARAPHRQAAFDGANYVMDWLKTDAPFWKREHGSDGEKWVAAKSSDDNARDRWQR